MKEQLKIDFEKILSTINIEFSPEILIKATPPFPGGLEIAQILSKSSVIFVISQIYAPFLRI